MANPSAEMIERYDERYRLVDHPVMRRIERSVIGADFGSTSYTTAAQADLLCELLDLAPGKRMLDVGTGAGWPGSYLAQSAGCEAVLTDIPFEGLCAAQSRIERESIDAAVIACSGAPLPFRNASFDAVTSSDVFC